MWQDGFGNEDLGWTDYNSVECGLLASTRKSEQVKPEYCRLYLLSQG